MFCPACEKSISDTAMLCHYCGARVTGGGGESRKEEAPPAAAAAGQTAGTGVAGAAGAAAGKIDEMAAKSPGLFFMYPILRALENGRVIRTIVALVLRINAVLTVLAGLYFVVGILKMAFSTHVGTMTTIGGLVFAGILLVAVAAVSQVYIYRAKTVDGLGDSPFTVMPIFSVLFRTGGEAYATMLVALGVGGCLMVWLAGPEAMMMLHELGPLMPMAGMGAESSGLGGLMFLVIMLLAAFGVLVAMYFLAEFVLVLADIARNVRRLAERA